MNAVEGEDLLELIFFSAPVSDKIPRHFSIQNQITLDDSNLRGFFSAGAAGVVVPFQKRLGCFLSCVVWTGYFFNMRGDLLVVHGFTVRCHRGSPPELDMNVRGHS